MKGTWPTLIVLLAIASGQSRGVDAAPAPSLLLITIDTLRADHLGAYGRRSAETPNLDSLASSGLLVENAFTHSPVTLSSHAALLTGRLPFQTGVRSNSLYRLPDDETTLAETLRGRGYRTAAFVSAAALDHRFGLGQGFEIYNDEMNPTEGGQLIAERGAREVVSAALAWLDDVGESPFFLWVHLFDPHHPYSPPEPFRSRFADSPYDGEIAYSDHQIGRLLVPVDLANTLVVATADHGESLGQHGEQTHGIFVYDATLRVPLILAGPGISRGARMKEGPVGLVDVVPTVLEKLGVERRPELAGKDVLREGPSDLLYAETYMTRDFYNWSPLRALRSRRAKFIEAPQSELYDLASDPGETKNLVEERQRTARQLSERLADYVAADDARDTSFQPDAKLLSELQSLGYVGGGVPANPRPAEDLRLPDPKDKIGIVTDLDDAISLFGVKRFEEAAAKLGEILRVDPTNFLASHYLGETLFELSSPRQAIEAYQRAIEQGNETPYHRFRLGLLHEQLKEYPAAAEQFGRTIDLDPDAALEVLKRARDLLKLGEIDGALQYLNMLEERGSSGASLALVHANAWERKGETGKALAVIDRALEADASNPTLLATRGRLLIELGRTEEAVGALEQASPGLKDPTENAAVVKTLATLYGNKGELEKAIAYFEQAATLTPNDSEIMANLALTLVRAGRTSEALEPLTRAIELRPEELRLLNLKAEILYRQGKLEGSRDLLRHSLALRPDQPRIKAALAEVEAKLESP